MNKTADTEAALAATRFAMGAAPGDIAEAKQDPREWLRMQLIPPLFDQALPDSTEALALHAKFRAIKRRLKDSGSMAGNVNAMTLKKARPNQYFNRYVHDAVSRSITAENSLAWRLLDFFSNHFSVTANNALMKFLAPTLEREAIAVNLSGRFDNMLIAVISHPAMLIYLNNEQSFGPSSRIGKRNARRGLNENLAREILELHTLGVNGGYTQQDVIELAKAISGWSVRRKNEKTDRQGFVFRARGHEPGKRILLGRKYNSGGIDQGRAILRDLAVHPSTARFVSTKLARHFISDAPAETLVEKMTKRWLATGGDIREVVITLIDSPEAWQATQQKYKTPRELLISAGRAAGPGRLSPRASLVSLTELGQKPFSAGSPAGYGDTAADWDGADALHARIEWAAQFSKRSRRNAIEMAEQSLGALMSKDTRRAILRAESQQQARTLLVMSPEFQRR